VRGLVFAFFRKRISVCLLEPEKALPTLRLSAPFIPINLFGLFRAGSGSSTIRILFAIRSQHLARLKRMRSTEPCKIGLPGLRVAEVPYSIRCEEPQWVRVDHNIVPSSLLSSHPRPIMIDITPHFLGTVSLASRGSSDIHCHVHPFLLRHR
jgi:hypothetical protein